MQRMFEVSAKIDKSKKEYIIACNYNYDYDSGIVKRTLIGNNRSTQKSIIDGFKRNISRLGGKVEKIVSFKEIKE